MPIISVYLFVGLIIIVRLLNNQKILLVLRFLITEFLSINILLYYIPFTNTLV